MSFSVDALQGSLSTPSLRRLRHREARVSCDPTGGTCPRISPSSKRGAGDKRNSRPIAIKQPRQDIAGLCGQCPAKATAGSGQRNATYGS